VGAVDERLGQVQLAASFQVFGERMQDTIERAVLDPALKSPMTGLIRRIAAR
jgi:hypothetical protein